MQRYRPVKELTIQKFQPLGATPQQEEGETGAETLALGALVWVLSDPTRAERLLSLTGLTPEDLRAGIGDRTVQGAVLEFLTNHEPDLVAAAEALDVEPAVLAAAAQELTR